MAYFISGMGLRWVTAEDDTEFPESNRDGE